MLDPVQDIHELLTGDGLPLDQERSDLVQCLTVLTEDPLRLLIAGLQHLHHLLVDGCRGIITTVHHCPSGIEIQGLLTLETHQSEALRHTILRYHRTCQLRRLLDIVGSAGRHRIKYDFLCCTTRQEGHQHRMKLCLRVQILLFLRHLHHIAECTHGTWYDGDLLYRLRILLNRGNQRMSDLMVGNDTTLLLTEDTVLLLLTDEHDLDRLEEVRLGHLLTTMLDRRDGCLVHHVCEICTDRTGSRQCNLVEIDGIIQLHILCMHLQNIDTSLEVRLLHDDTTVETARTQQCRVEDFRTVRRTHDHDPLRGIEAIHLRQQLVQGLLALLVSTEAGISRLTDGIDLIDEDDARCRLRRLLKQITHTTRTDTDEHLDEIRTGQTVERHLCLTGHGLRK